LLATGCGSKEREPRVAGAGCAGPSSQVPLPRAFPRRFPLPEGGVLTHVGREAGSTLVEGYVPGRSLGEVRDAFRRDLPAAGYRLGEGDAEEHEAETEFSGRGYAGHLKLRDDVCSGAVTFGVALRPAR
jgi:hypothetical protein